MTAVSGQGRRHRSCVVLPKGAATSQRERRSTMRSLILAFVLGLATLTVAPRQAEAQWRHRYYTPYVYPYAYTAPYYAPGYAYTPGYYYTPGYTYTPGYYWSGSYNA